MLCDPLYAPGWQVDVGEGGATIVPGVQVPETLSKLS